jgi:hypothetical protein
MRPSSPDSPLTYTFGERCVSKMDLFHKLMELIDKNTETIPEGDYLKMCDTIKELRERVKPPSFLLDQNQPLWVSDETEATGTVPVYEPTIMDWSGASTPEYMNYQGVRMRGNTDEMTDEDLALVARAVAHEEFIAEANYVVQNGHS